MTMRTRLALSMGLVAAIPPGGAVFAQQQSVDVTVRHAPYVVSTVSSKSEKAWAACTYCGSKTSYDRTYRWDPYNHKWIENTDPDKVPNVCRKCRAKVRDQEKLDMRERDLDRKIRYESTKARIRQKSDYLKDLRNANR